MIDNYKQQSLGQLIKSVSFVPINSNQWIILKFFKAKNDIFWIQLVLTEFQSARISGNIFVENDFLEKPRFWEENEKKNRIFGQSFFKMTAGKYNELYKMILVDLTFLFYTNS